MISPSNPILSILHHSFGWRGHDQVARATQPAEHVVRVREPVTGPESHLEPFRAGDPVSHAADVTEDLVQGHEPLAQLRHLSLEDGVLGLDVEQVPGRDVDPREDPIVLATELGSL